MVSWGVNFPHKNGPIPLWLVSPPFDTFKIPPTYMLFQVLQIWQLLSNKIQSFLLLLDTPGKPDHQVIHCPAANFGSLSRGSVTNHILITVFDTYLTLRSPGAPFCWRGDVEPPTKFSKRGSLTGPHFLEGSCWETGGYFFQ